MTIYLGLKQQKILYCSLLIQKSNTGFSDLWSRWQQDWALSWSIQGTICFLDIHLSESASSWLWFPSSIFKWAILFFVVVVAFLMVSSSDHNWKSSMFTHIYEYIQPTKSLGYYSVFSLLRNHICKVCCQWSNILTSFRIKN